MRSRIFCALLGLAMGWTVVGAPALGSPRPNGRYYNQALPPYTPQRIIALQKGTGACPKVVDWQEESLPDLVRRRTETQRRDCEQGRTYTAREANERNRRSIRFADLLHKHDLDRFCIYTTRTSRSPFPEAKSVGLESATPDRMALMPMADPDLGAVGNQTWPKLADRFLGQAGRVHLPSTTAPGVRLVYIDSNPTGEGPPAPPVPTPGQPYPSWHGHAMANLGNEMVCGYDAPEHCAIHVATRLALRYDHDSDMSISTDPASGHLGLVSELGTAILEELSLWQTSYPGMKLVLNLSVGWEDSHGLDAWSAKDLEASSQEVWKALGMAKDYADVLVVAAAGNRIGGEVSTAPLLPAAWETHAPGWFRCFLPKRIYAVGGVDWQGLPLPNSRSGETPARVAYGDHAVAVTNTSGTTKIYTGTSVSAVVASAIAATAWYLKPDLTPAQVMDRLDWAGETFHSFGGPVLNRLSLHRTIDRLCGPDGSLCTSSRRALPLAGPDTSPADFSTILSSESTILSFMPMRPAPRCATLFMSPLASISEDHGCPMEMLPDMMDSYRVAEQPHENPCPTCTVVPDPPALKRVAALAASPGLLEGKYPVARKPYNLVAALDPEWAAQAHGRIAIRSAILVVNCASGSPFSERVDLTRQFQDLLDPRDPASPGWAKLAVGTIGTRPTIARCTASVDFTLMKIGDGTERSVQSPVYVDP